MRYLRTFEQYSPVLVNEEEENFFKKMMQGGKTFKIDGKELDSLLSKQKEFSLVDGKVKGTKSALAFFSGIREAFGMTDMQALEASLKIADWNGFVRIDPTDSKWDKDTLELTVIVAKSSRGTGFNTN
jgi:hypothetical protein